MLIDTHIHPALFKPICTDKQQMKFRCDEMNYHKMGASDMSLLKKQYELAGITKVFLLPEDCSYEKGKAAISNEDIAQLCALDPDFYVGFATVDPRNEDAREKTIVRTSIIGILVNVLLAAFKAAVGVLTSSIAIVLDAVNNLSDAASSIITIVGTKLAAREPDRKHPFGYGRIEYLSAMIISVIVLYAGVTSLIESIKKIIHPETPDYSVTALIIVAVGVLVKILLGRYVKGVGEKVNSDSLINSGKDATLDSVISASTLAAALIFLASGLSLEAWLGAVISLIIIRSGVEMLRETISEILGQRADAELVREIKKTVLSFPPVSGAYDLVLHKYRIPFPLPSWMS